MSDYTTNRICANCDEVCLHTFDFDMLGLSDLGDGKYDLRFNYRCDDCGFECTEVEVLNAKNSISQSCYHCGDSASPGEGYFQGIEDGGTELWLCSSCYEYEIGPHDHPDLEHDQGEPYPEPGGTILTMKKKELKVQLPPAAHEAFKAYCKQRGLTMTTQVTLWIHEALNDRSSSDNLPSVNN